MLSLMLPEIVLRSKKSKILLSYQQTPVYEINHPLVKKAGLRLLIKREDLNHPTVSGNKWWKLKYNLAEAMKKSHDTILTFGGAYSNHIYATAAAAHELKLNSIGIIRGEEALPLNPTLQFAVHRGMKLHYISRSAYREKSILLQSKALQQRFGKFYMIPEGGTNVLAIRGCEEFGRLIDLIPSNYICLPVGTGGTMSGIVRGISPGKKVLGFSVLKDGRFLRAEIEKFTAGLQSGHWQLLTEYGYGGYGKRNAMVSTFIKSFFDYTKVPLDFVYTGKMMCAVFDLIEKHYFKKGETILAIHTGGLQGHS